MASMPARPFVIEIAESAAFLEKRLKPAKTGLCKERLPILPFSHCPELNPIKRFWQRLKATWKGENVLSLEALQQRVE